MSESANWFVHILHLAGIFLIPYFIILFVCGVPMLFMELAVGQYTGRGPIGAIGQLCPLFKGLKSVSESNWIESNHIDNNIWINYYFQNHLFKKSKFTGTGMASVIISFLMSTYYSVIIAYAIYYFFSAFRPEMPWLDCAHRYVFFLLLRPVELYRELDISFVLWIVRWTTADCWIPERLEKNMTRPTHSRTPAEEFFE